MSGGEVRNMYPGDIQMVQNLIEQCLPYYLNQKQVIDIIYQQEKIEPSFTELVWQKLEEQNPDFFKGYHLRLMVKDQIMEFNKLLDKQAALMQQLGPSGVNFQSQFPQKRENIASFSRAFDNCGLPIPSGDPQPHSRRIDVPPNILLARNTKVGMTDGVSVKTESKYLGDFIYGTNGNVLEARPTTGDASASSFSCLESDPHQLNGSLLNDGSLFGLLDPMSHNFDMLENFSRSAFLSSDRDNFLDSHRSTIEHQGENKRLDIPGFEDFGSES